jgi:hypothetical protein
MKTCIQAPHLENYYISFSSLPSFYIESKNEGRERKYDPNTKIWDSDSKKIVGFRFKPFSYTQPSVSI